MDTQARIGYGTTFEMADLDTPTEFAYVAEVSNITPPNEQANIEDATHMASPNRYREFIEGLTDAGEVSFEMNYVPGSPSDLLLLQAKGRRKWSRITFPNGVQILFVGLRQGYERTAPTDTKKTATVTFKVSGAPVQTPIAAPRNIVAPVVSGAAAVGAPLTLDWGIWAGALDIEVQWQKDTDGEGPFVDIVGANELAYVPTADDVDDRIRAKVTGSNDEFETIANSAPTVAVVDPNAE
jgi:hypothetical protein